MNISDWLSWQENLSQHLYTCGIILPINMAVNLLLDAVMIRTSSSSNLKCKHSIESRCDADWLLSDMYISMYSVDVCPAAQSLVW